MAEAAERDGVRFCYARSILDSAPVFMACIIFWNIFNFVDKVMAPLGLFLNMDSFTNWANKQPTTILVKQG
jgi:hypothetical protein